VTQIEEPDTAHANLLKRPVEHPTLKVRFPDRLPFPVAEHPVWHSRPPFLSRCCLSRRPQPFQFGRQLKRHVHATSRGSAEAGPVRHVNEFCPTSASCRCSPPHSPLTLTTPHGPNRTILGSPTTLRRSMVCRICGQCGGPNNFLVAVSKSSDPTKGWKGFAVPSDSGGTRWADLPTLGVNRDGVYVAANMFQSPRQVLPAAFSYSRRRTS
jgi:hypothetical protein